MINTNFDLNLVNTDENGETKEETIKIVIQEISPFRVADIMSGAMNVNSGQYNVGILAESFISEVIVSPKNLKERIEGADNAMDAITKVVTEVRSFCNNPRKYALLQTESAIKSQSVVNGNTESNIDGSQANV
jgi:hypothetical protein